jgi:hypothetical protein
MNAPYAGTNGYRSRENDEGWPENDIDFDDTPRVTTPNPEQRFATAAPTAVYTARCTRCNGTGKFRSMYGNMLGNCFACKGTGTKSFKTAPEVRAKARDQAAARKVRSAEENLEAFAQAEPALHAWMVGTDFDFARAMLDAVRQYGSLTDGQRAAVERCIERAAARDAAKVAAKVAAQARVQAVDAGALFAAFLRAAGNGLKHPKLTFGEFKVARASATGRNPGALYVTAGEQYLGKIQDGQFFPSRECSDEVKAQVIALIEDPAAAVKAYGLRTGNCAICNRTLTNGESVERGIGPICAEKFGW